MRYITESILGYIIEECKKYRFNFALCLALVSGWPIVRSDEGSKSRSEDSE